MTNPQPTSVLDASAVARPVQDEWGFYDPKQAGFEAMMRRVTAPRVERTDLTATPADGA